MNLRRIQADSVIFDLDGTLWNSTDVVVRAWNTVLSRIGRKVTAEDMSGIMGLQREAIGEKLFPDLALSDACVLMDECGALECTMLQKEGGRLYPELEDTLRSLSLMFPLYIVSNCQCGYIESFLEPHKLGVYFKDYLCAEETGYTKGENIRALMERNGLHSSVYVGDTKGDEEAARAAEIPFIYAAYGFGTAVNSDAAIQQPKELLNLLERNPL